MCKKITLAIAVVVVLTGAATLIAQERDVDRPRGSEVRDPVRPVDRPAAIRERGEQAERIQPDRGRREQARRGDQPGPEPAMRMEGRRQPAPPMAPAKTAPVQENFSRLLDGLAAAYRQNDREKMGEIIQQMQQLRRQWQAPGKVSAEPPRNYPQGPKKVGKLQPGPEKKAPKPAKKTPQPAKKLPQTWQSLQSRFPAGLPGWGRCPRCGWGPRWGAMAGRGMAFQGRGFGWRRQEVRPPALKDRPAGPARPQDVPGPMQPERPRGFGWWRQEVRPPALNDRSAAPGPPQGVPAPMSPERLRGFGWWRQQGSPPPIMQRQDAPAQPEDMNRPNLPERPRGMGRRGWGPMSPMAPEGGPEPAAPRPD